MKSWILGWGVGRGIGNSLHATLSMAARITVPLRCGLGPGTMSLQIDTAPGYMYRSVFLAGGFTFRMNTFRETHAFFRKLSEHWCETISALWYSRFGANRGTAA